MPPRRQDRRAAGADERHQRHPRPGPRRASSSFHVWASARLGVGGYLGKFFSLREFENGVAAGLIALFVGLIEFMLEFVKPITLAMRLFGNIYGGEVALAVITSLTIAIIPVALIGLETFVGFVQALIFSVLTLMFTMLAIEGHHDEHEDAHDVVEDMPNGRHGPPARASPHDGGLRRSTSGASRTAGQRPGGRR